MDQLLQKAVGLLEEGGGDASTKKEDEEGGDENVQNGAGDEPDLLVRTVSLEEEERR
jgi:hypothetical protein